MYATSSTGLHSRPVAIPWYRLYHAGTQRHLCNEPIDQTVTDCVPVNHFEKDPCHPAAMQPGSRPMPDRDDRPRAKRALHTKLWPWHDPHDIMSGYA